MSPTGGMGNTGISFSPRRRRCRSSGRARTAIETLRGCSRIKSYIRHREGLTAFGVEIPNKTLKKEFKND